MAEAPNARATLLATRHRSLQQARSREKISSSAFLAAGLFLLSTFRPTLDSYVLDLLLDIVVKGYFVLSVANAFLLLWKTMQLAACKRELRQFPLKQLALLGIRKEDIYPNGTEPPPEAAAVKDMGNPKPAPSQGTPFRSANGFLSNQLLRSPSSAQHTSILDMASPSGSSGSTQYTSQPDRFSPFNPSYSTDYAATDNYGFGGSTAVPQNPTRYHPSPPQAPRPVSDRRIVPAHEVWSRVVRGGTESKDIRLAVNKCQRWMINTILLPLLREIDAVNSDLAARRANLRIGRSALAEFDRLFETVQSQEIVGRFARLRPYLTLHQDQVFLEQRIRGLAMVQQGANGGPSHPSDTQILIHMFCCYCDMVLYRSTHSLEGRFTALHFLGQTEVPTTSMKCRQNLSDFYIFLTNSVPVSAQVLLVRDGDELILSLSPGPENAYDVILLAMCNARDRHGGRMDEEDMYGLPGLGAESLPPPVYTQDPLDSFLPAFKKVL